MSFDSLLYGDCCFLINIDLNSQRIRQILERRFKSNSNRISFDFKSFSSEQPSNNAKVSRSFLRFQPKINSADDSDEYISSDSDSTEEQDDDDTGTGLSTNDDDDDDDDYYRKLAEWEPKTFEPINETDDEEEDNDEVEDTIQSTTTTTTEKNKEDDETNQMDLSSDITIIQDTPASHVEDLLVTFIHRPLKSEPMNYDDNVFSNPPQLDGLVDLSTDELSTPLSRNNTGKSLDEIIAKVNERTLTQKKTIQLHRIPPLKSNFRLADGIKRPSISKTSRKSISSPVKTDRPKEQSVRREKCRKKPISQIFNAVMKNNIDAIRESDTRLSSSNNKKTSRLLSDSSLQTTTAARQQDQRRLISQQQIRSSFHTNRTSVSDNRQFLSQSKEKSASHHMKLAQRKLNHFQEKEQQSKSSTSNLSSIKSASKENKKTFSKPSKSIDPFVRRSASTSNALQLNNHNQQVKKKVKKVKRLSTEQSTLSFHNQSRTTDSLSSRIEKCETTKDNAVHKQQLTSHSVELMDTTISSNNKTNKRPATFFDGCIVIDDDDENEEHHNNNIEDDDIQEIERQQYSLAYDIHARQKDLDHIVHSSPMHIKWLFNLEYLLLDHILICHENNLRSCNKVYENSVVIKCEHPSDISVYQIEPSFISIIIINFIKVFLLRNSLDDQQEFSFAQFGITSHLRYLLIELPTYVHNGEKDLHDDCSKCHQYSLIINILFDLLFDFIEYDLCGMTSKVQYRSSLIEDDYFSRFLQSKFSKQNPFYRIKLIIYFIELIGIHMSKCQNRKQFQFNQNENKLFHSIEQFIRHIISQLTNLIAERISLCFNVMELCLLFVNEKHIRMKQMSLFLAELCKDDMTHWNVFLFDENLFTDIRLLLVNELIGNKFKMKFVSVNHVNTFFQQIQDALNPKVPIDETALLLLRSLLNTYANLIIEIKAVPSMYSNDTQRMTLLLQNQFELVFRKLVEVSFDDPTYFKQIERTLIYYRLLKCKWNKL